MPNLEQVGLLHVEYVDLPEIAADHESWARLPSGPSRRRPDLREELAAILLDELRRVLAIDVDCLTELGFERSSASRASTSADRGRSRDGERLAGGTAFPRSGAPGGRGRPQRLRPLRLRSLPAA